MAEINREICRAICIDTCDSVIMCGDACRRYKAVDAMLHQSTRAAVERYDKAVFEIPITKDSDLVINYLIENRKRELSAIGIGGKEGERG